MSAEIATAEGSRPRNDSATDSTVTPAATHPTLSPAEFRTGVIVRIEAPSVPVNS
ncbi:hypothetical protein [Microbacterium sp. AK031]|uniref:hypothetical protein n=1 Tax=Microbacterium sp. AK031 TaxID=2723076 RepID=UPI00216985C8|nr:hypothetical protein [Microbacterium sp. AK031]MCS3842289.1 hypothetical protein [Microbacterium sp. AK031]